MGPFYCPSDNGIYIDTDFYLDEKTHQIKGYDSSYDIRGRAVTTSVEVDKLRVVDGITVPDKYAQRIDTEQITLYAVFKTKEILVNTPVDASSPAVIPHDTIGPATGAWSMFISHSLAPVSAR